MPQIFDTSKKDSGYAWIILLAAYYAQFISVGFAFSFAIFFDALADHFQATSVQISWIGSINQALLFLFCPIAGLCIGKFGYKLTVGAGGVLTSLGYLLSYFATELWHLYVTYSVMVGIGFSLMYLPTASISAFWFDRYKPIAIGIVSSANGLGTFINGLVIGKLQNAGISWQFCMLVEFGFSLVVVIAAVFLKPGPADTELPEDDNDLPLKVDDPNLSPSDDKADKQLFLAEVTQEQPPPQSMWEIARKPTYILFLINNIIWPLNSSVFYVHCINLSNTMSPQHTSLWIISIIGLIDCFGRLFGGFSKSFVCRSVSPITFWTLGLSCCAISVACSPWIDSAIHPLVSSILFGFFFGLQLSMIILVSVTLFDEKQLPLVYGGLAGSNAIGNLLGASSAASFYEWMYTSNAITTPVNSTISLLNTTSPIFDVQASMTAYQTTFGVFGGVTLVLCFVTMVPIIFLHKKATSANEVNR